LFIPGGSESRYQVFFIDFFEISHIPDIQYDAFSGMLDLNYNVISLLQQLNIGTQRKIMGIDCALYAQMQR